jgi:hypothetical protein
VRDVVDVVISRIVCVHVISMKAGEHKINNNLPLLPYIRIGVVPLVPSPSSIQGATFSRKLVRIGLKIWHPHFGRLRK